MSETDYVPKEVPIMKKLFALMLVLCLALTAAAVAEEEFGYYPDE